MQPLRTFVWIFLLFFLSWPSQADETSLVLQDGHTSPVLHNSWLSDSLLLTISGDGTAKWWEFPSGRITNSLPLDAQADPISDAVNTNEGLWVAHESGKLALWNTKGREVIRTLSAPKKSLKFASGSDKEIWLHASGRSLYKVDGERVKDIPTKSNANLTCAAVGPSGKVAFGTRKGWALLSNSTSELKQAPASAQGVHSLAFSEDGSKLYLGTRRDWLEGWDPNTGSLLFDSPATKQAPSRERIGKGPLGGQGFGLVVSESRPGEVLCSNMMGEVSTYNLAEKRIEPRARLGQFGVTALSLSPDLQKLAFAFGKRGPKDVHLLQQTSAAWSSLTWSGSSANFAGVFVDGQNLLVLNDSGYISHFDLESGQLRRLFQVGRYPRIVAQGSRLYVGSDDRLVRAFDLASGELLWEKTVGRAQGIALSPDGLELAVVTYDSYGQLHILSIADGEKLRTLTTEGKASAPLYTEDGRQLLWLEPAGVALFDRLYKKRIHTWQVPQFAGSRVVGVAENPTVPKLLVLTANADLFEVDRIDLNSKPTGRRLEGAELAVSLHRQGRSLLIGADRGALLCTLQGEVKRKFGSHLSPISGAGLLGNLIVTSGWDYRLHLWELTSGEKRATLVSLNQGRDWLLTTPSLHFDGSQEAFHKISWRWNGANYTFDQCFEKFYRPSLLAHLVQGVVERGEMSQAPELGSTPARVRLSEPKQLSGRRYQVELKVEAESSEWTDPRLYHNGHRLPGNSPYVFKAAPGKNKLRASVRNAEGSLESAPETLTFHHKEAPKPKRLHLFAAGVNDYPAPLNFAVEDAQEFAEVFKAGELFDQVEKHTLFEGEATKEKILARLQAIECNPEDTLVVFLAGHGLIVDEKFYYLPHGAQGEDGLSGRELAEALASLPATHQVLFLDTCHSGAMGTDLATAVIKRKAALGASAGGSRMIRQQKILARQAGTFLVAGSSPDNTAAEVSQLRHGLFTHAVLEGLKSTDDEDGQVTVNELLSYLNRVVPKLSQKYRGNPDNIWQFSTGTDFPLVKKP